MNDNYICVVGGINLDLSATSYSIACMEDSNPGKISYSPGGVGRNIAENICRLGEKVSLIAPFGSDEYSKFLIESCNEIGIDLSNSLNFPNENTGMYVCVNDFNGEMLIAISAMDICQKVSPKKLASKLAFINKAKLIVLDANLPEASLVYIAEKSKVPVFADAVSVAKCSKIKKILPKLTLLKANRFEAEALSDIKINSVSDLENAAKALLDTGLKNIIITLGKDGAYFANKNKQGKMPSLKVNVLNVTGCGDAFMSAATVRYLYNQDLEDMVKYGIVAAGLSATHDSAVFPYLSMDMIERHLKDIEY
ncbi:MAG: carbohydrate kinase [Christensenellaceae bacterium]|nr:carbohydrate kinase [Christensenellaceae bacterium]